MAEHYVTCFSPQARPAAIATAAASGSLAARARCSFQANVEKPTRHTKAWGQVRVLACTPRCPPPFFLLLDLLPPVQPCSYQLPCRSFALIDMPMAASASQELAVVALDAEREREREELWQDFCLFGFSDRGEGGVSP